MMGFGFSIAVFKEDIMIWLISSTKSAEIPLSDFTNSQKSLVLVEFVILPDNKNATSLIFKAVEATRIFSWLLDTKCDVFESSLSFIQTIVMSGFYRNASKFVHIFNEDGNKKSSCWFPKVFI